METVKAKQTIMYAIRHLQNKTFDIVFYRNPNEFCHFYYEKVNPDHVGVVYGLRKRKHRKNRGSGLIRVAKVTLNSVCLAVYNNLSPFIDRCYYYLGFMANNVDLVAFVYYCGIGLILCCILLGYPLWEMGLLAKAVRG